MQGNVTFINKREILPVMKRPVPPLRAGLFGIGLEAYWPQFQCLMERLEGYVQAVSTMLARPGVEIVNPDLIVSPERIMEAGHPFRREDVIFLYVTTYATSSTALLNIRIETFC